MDTNLNNAETLKFVKNGISTSSERDATLKPLTDDALKTTSDDLRNLMSRHETTTAHTDMAKLTAVTKAKNMVSCLLSLC